MPCRGGAAKKHGGLHIVHSLLLVHLNSIYLLPFRFCTAWKYLFVDGGVFLYAQIIDWILQVNMLLFILHAQ